MVNVAPLVSVLLPTHRRPDVLPLAIQSALAQTVQDFELLVVGDGCDDGTADVVRQFDDPRVIWFDLPKAFGVGNANRNVALRRARGDLVAYLAHDDLWLPDHLEMLTAVFEDQAVDFAYSLPLDVSEDGTITPQFFDLGDSRVRDLWLNKQIGYLPSTNVIHRRRCLSQFGYWDETLPMGGDWELWRRILDGGGWRNFRYVAVPTSLHFVAIWRRYPRTWRRKLWRRVRRWEGSAAPAFEMANVAGRTEQEAVWNLIHEHGAAWIRDLRCAVREEGARRNDASFLPSALLEHVWRYVRALRSHGDDGSRPAQRQS